MAFQLPPQLRLPAVEPAGVARDAEPEDRHSAPEPEQILRRGDADVNLDRRVGDYISVAEQPQLERDVERLAVEGRSGE